MNPIKILIFNIHCYVPMARFRLMRPDRIVRTVIYCDYASVIGTVPPGIRKSLYDC